MYNLPGFNQSDDPTRISPLQRIDPVSRVFRCRWGSGTRVFSLWRLFERPLVVSHPHVTRVPHHRTEFHDGANVCDKKFLLESWWSGDCAICQIMCLSVWVPAWFVDICMKLKPVVHYDNQVLCRFTLLDPQIIHVVRTAQVEAMSGFQFYGGRISSLRFCLRLISSFYNIEGEIPKRKLQRKLCRGRPAGWWSENHSSTFLLTWPRRQT